MYKDSKPMNEYDNINGKISYIGETYENLPNRNFGKYRYILLDSYPSVIEVFIGKETGDFKPKYENIDNLKLDDSIAIYGDNLSENLYINRGVLFIKKENELYFEQGNSKVGLGIGIILISIFLSILGYVLMKKKKIEYWNYR